jgi:hypothetical protein
MNDRPRSSRARTLADIIARSAVIVCAGLVSRGYLYAGRTTAPQPAVNSHKKEMKSMEYTKPKIVAQEPAIEMIQGMKFSGHPDVVQAGNPIPSNSAYEASE